MTQIAAHVLIKSASEDENGNWIVSGPVCSLKEDYDGETLEKSGIMKGLEMFKRLGWHIDYAHQYAQTHDPDYLIGKGLQIKEVDGVPWLSVMLFKAKKLAKKVWDHLQAGGEMGFSIEGIAKARDAKNPKRVLETEIHRITIDPMPKGFEDARQIRIGGLPSAMALAKSLVDGSVEVSENIDPIEQMDPIEKAAVPHAIQKCKNCGGKMYCIHCHRNAAGKSMDDAAMTKAMEAGEGIVAAGSQESAAPLRKQSLRKKVAEAGPDCAYCSGPMKDGVCGDCGKPAPGKSVEGNIRGTKVFRDDLAAETRSKMEKAFADRGSKHPGLLARILMR